MGLDVQGWSSEYTYSAGYGGLHDIRGMALIAQGELPKVLEALPEYERLWRNRHYFFMFDHEGEGVSQEQRVLGILTHHWLYGTHMFSHAGPDDIPPKYEMPEYGKPFWQLYHFSDCEGVFVSDGLLKGIDISESYYLGNANWMLRDLELIKDSLARNPDEYQKYFYPDRIATFWSLYDVFTDEVNNGSSIIRFS